VPPAAPAVVEPASFALPPDPLLTVGRPADAGGPEGPAPASVPRYEVLEELGRGGMGVVYKARDTRLGRLVALKMILHAHHAGPSERDRFRDEARAVARLSHPNVVQVYEVGETGGLPFFALEFFPGGSLARRLGGTPLPPGDAARLVEVLARAVQAAHEAGVVHRDLKPANVLLAADGTPKVADFGLAKLAGGDSGRTATGAVLGTPSYMAPEQAQGKKEVGPQVDVYALGAVLYECLTGRPPFRAATPAHTVLQVLREEPAPPRRLNPQVPADLETVCLKCLAKEPAQRYPSAAALAEDLRRFGAGLPVRARPVGAAGRVWRWCRRNPALAAALAAVAASLVGGLAGVAWKWVEADEEKQAALRQAYRARLAAAIAALSGHDVAEAARQLDDAPEGLRGWEWRHLRARLDDSSSVIPLPAGGGAFLPNEPDRLRVQVWTGASLRLTDLEGGEPKTLPVRLDRGGPGAAAQTRRGLRVAVWVGNTTLELLDETGHVLCRVEVPDARWVGPVVVSPDGTRLASIWDDGEWKRLAVFDATSGKRTAVCDGHRGDIRSFAFSPNGARLASAGEDQVARLWDPASGALLATCQGHTSKVLGAAFSPDGARLVTASSDGTVRQWDARTGREVEAPYDRHSGDVAAAVYSSDGHWVASAGTDRTVRVWRARGRQDVAVLHGHTGAVIGVAFARDGRRLASVSCDTPLAFAADGTVRVWDVDPRAPLPVLRGHASYVYPVAFSPDGRWVASGGWDNAVRLWDAATGEWCATLPHPGYVLSLAFSPDGRSLVTGSHGDDRLRIWDVATARVRKEIQGPGRGFRSLTVSPDGRRVAACADYAPFRVYDLASGEPLFSAEGRALAYSPDGRWLAVVRAADDKTVGLLDARTHEPVAGFRGHEKAVLSAAFSPDSRRLASCSSDRTVRVWPTDPATQPSPPGEGREGVVRECRVLGGHTDEVFAAAFHPDGTRLATAGRDRAVCLWDLARGEEVARLAGHTSYVWSLAFSPDGATLASGSGDFTVRLWDTAPLKARYEARRRAAALRPEAERLVGQLWREEKGPDKVAEAVQADRGLSEPLRQAALRAVLRRARPPEAAPGDPPDAP
jgi:WD40 repeat protein